MTPDKTNIINCRYNSEEETITVLSLSDSNANISWDDCIVTIHNVSNETTIPLSVNDEYLEAGDRVNLSSYVSPGNQYFFTIAFPKDPFQTYEYTWTQ